METGSGRKLRVLAVASGGGHWVQLMRLKSAFAGGDIAYATSDRSSMSDVPGARFHVIPEATRWSRWGLLRSAAAILWILLRERPDVVISTGAAPGYFALTLGKLLGSRTIWIDSIANVEEMSLSGQKAGRAADLWLTQWPELAQAGGPRYEGAVL